MADTPDDPFNFGIPQTTLKPMSYRDLSDFHARMQTAHPDVFGSMSLQDFSRGLNEAAGQPIAQAGVNDSWLKHASVGVDRALDATGVNDALASAGGAVGSVFGEEGAGERAGRGFARGALNFAPLIASEALTGGGATIPILAGTALSAGLSGAQTYTETGSPTAGLISGAATALAPVAGHYGGQLALRAVGAPVWDETSSALAKLLASPPSDGSLADWALPKVGERFGSTTSQKVAQFLGSNLGAVAEGEVAGETQSEVAGTGLYNPFTADHLFETALSMGPYAALGIPGLRRSSAAEFVRNFMETSDAARKADATTAGQNYAAGVTSNSDLATSMAGEPRSVAYNQPGQSELTPDLLSDHGLSSPRSKFLEQLDTSRQDLLNRADQLPMFGLDPDDWQKRTDSLMAEWNDLENQENVIRGKVILPDEQIAQVSPTAGRDSGIGNDVTAVPTTSTDAVPTDATTTGITTPDTAKNISGVPVPAQTDFAGNPVAAGGARPIEPSLTPDARIAREGLKGNRRKPIMSAQDAIDEQLSDMDSSETGSNLDHVFDPQPKPTPLPASVEASLIRKDTSLPEKPTTEQVRQHVADTVTIRDALRQKYGQYFSQLTDTDVIRGIKQFVEDNPNHPDPTSGYAERFRAQTLRKANDDNTLAHAGENIGTDQAAMENGIRLLSEKTKGSAVPIVRDKTGGEYVNAAAVKDTKGTVFTGTWHGEAVDKLKATTNEPNPDYTEGFVTNKGRYIDRQEAGKLASGYGVETRVGRTDAGDFGFFKTEPGQPGDADTVARIIKEHESKPRQGVSNALGIPEAVYRAYGAFRAQKGDVPYSQSELAGFLSSTAAKARMKGEAQLSARGQNSLDRVNDTTGKDLHGAVAGSEGFGQLDPGVMKMGEDKMSAQDQLHEDHTVAGHDVAAVSDDLNLLHTLGKLTWLVKERPDLWRQIWQKGTHDVGEARTRIYINKAFENMQARSGTMSPAELNRAFAQYDAGHVTELAYYRKDKVTGARTLTTSLPPGLFEKFGQVFQYLQGLPEYGVEGAKGSRNFLSSVNLDQGYSRGTRGASLISTGDMYTRLFRERMGYSNLQARAMAEHMQRIVAAFGPSLDRLRVGALDDRSQELGLYIKKLGDPFWEGMVGIAQNNFGTARQNFVMHQLVLAHEMWHGIENQYQMQLATGHGPLPDAMVQAFSQMDQISSQLTPDQRSSFMGEVRDMILPKFRNADMDRILSQSADNPTEFRATLGSLLTMNHVGEDVPQAKGMRQLLMEAPKEFADMLRSTVKYVGDMARGLWGAIKGQGLFGGLNIADPSQEILAKSAKDYVNAFNEVMQSNHVIDQAVNSIQQYEQLAPDAYSQMVQANRLSPISTAAYDGPEWATAAMKGVKEELGLDGDKVTKPSFLQRTLENFTQLSERYPLLRTISNIAYNSQHASERNLAKLNSILGMEVDVQGNGKMDPKLTTVMNVAKNISARDAFSGIARAQQDKGGLIDRQDPRVTTALSKLPDQLKDKVWSMFERVNTQNIMVGNERVSAMHEINGLIVSKFIQELEPTRPAQVTERIGQSMMDGLRDNNIGQIMQATQELQPETAKKVSALASNLFDSWSNLKAKTEAQPWYFTERRYGDYAVTYKTADGKTGRASAPTQGQLDDIVSREIKNGSTILRRLTPDDMRKPYSQFNDTYRQAVIEAQDKSQALLQTLLKDQPELLARISPLLDIEGDASAEMQANDVRKLNPFRRKAAGREYVDYLDASTISNNATIRGLGRRWLRAKSALYLADPSFAKEPALQRLASQHVDNMLTNDSPVGQALSKANFYYYIVGNLANMIQEPFQQLSTVLPALQREGGGFFSSQGKLLNANREIAKYWQSGKTGNAEHDAILSKFTLDRENPHGFLSDFDSDGLGAMNAVRYSNGQPLLDKVEAIAKPLTSLVSLAKNAYLKVPEHNARVTLLAAYDLAREKGMSSDAAYQDALRVYRYSNFAGGKANRAVGIYSGRDPFTKGAAQTLMSLQSYQTGYLGMMSRMISQGFGKGRLQGPEGYAAKKAAVTMLGVQFALAGGLGMPFAGAGVAMLQQLFPNLQLQKNIREAIAGLVGEDSDAAGFVTNSVTHGVLGELVGADLSSRFGLGNMFGMSSYGYDPTNILGPTGGAIRNMVLGIQDASVGQIGKATQDVVPPQLKHLVEAYRQGGQFRDNQNNLLFEGTDTEKAFRLLGYTPTRERDVREQQTILKRSQDIASQDLSRFYSQQADQIGAGNYAGVRDALLQKQRQDYTFDARAGLRKIAQVSEERLNPTDLRNQGSARTADDRQQLLRTYQSQGGTTEVQRLQQRSNIERMVGIQGAGHISPTELRVAEMVDHLTTVYPTMTIDQVRALANHTIARRMTPEERDQLLPQGFGY